MNKYPTKTIIFITPTEQNNESCNSNNTTGLTPTDFSQAMKKVCAKYAIPVIDSNSSCGIYPLDDKNASIYTTDKIHLNDAGHERLAQQVMSFVQSNCYVPEGGVNLAEYSINGVSQAYYTNDTLNLIVNKTYGGVALPNVIEMSVDLSCYSDALIAENGKGIGFFGFKQADGTYKVLSLYAGTNDVENEGLEVITGQSAILSSDLTNMSGLVRGGHWSAPTAKPQRADVVLENGTAKVYIDDSEVYSVTCEELAFITTTRFCDDLAGLTLTYADV